MTAATLYHCEVMHRRHRSAGYQFSYRIFGLLIDIDRLGELERTSPLLSVGRFNLLSFYPRDHLPKGQHDLRDWLNRVLQDHDIDGDTLRVQLLCMPRILGWGFNPLSVWYCEDQDQNPVAIVCEVHNTFGERHCYLLLPKDSEWPVRASQAKRFHVSPFLDIAGQYDFVLKQPRGRLGIAIRLQDQKGPLLDATQTGRAIPPTSRNLLLQCLQIPFQTAKVLGAIHWQALKIWLRGATFYRKPEPPTEEIN